MQVVLRTDTLCCFVDEAHLTGIHITTTQYIYILPLKLILSFFFILLIVNSLIWLAQKWGDQRAKGALLVGALTVDTLVELVLCIGFCVVCVFVGEVGCSRRKFSGVCIVWIGCKGMKSWIGA